MSIEMSLYLADVIPTLGTFLIIIGVIATFGTLIAYAVHTEGDSDTKFFKYGCFCFGFLMVSFIGIMAPSHAATSKMLVASLAKELQNNPKVQAIEDRLYNVIDSKLKELEEKK